jgi:acyl-CoA dehydrogenase
MTDEVSAPTVAFELPPRYLELQSAARELAESCADIAVQADESDHAHPETRARLQASGLARVMVPAEFGGQFERVDSLAATVVREALGYESAHLDSLFAMQGIGSYAVSVGAGDEVRKKWLPQVASLDAIAALALTEPQVGSDLRSITTTVEERSRTLIVTGHKSFITNAGDADFYCVLAREGDLFSLVFIPAATPGVSVEHPHQIIAPHVIGDVIFDNVSVPASHRLSVPGDGFKLALKTLATFRCSVAGAAVGLAQGALDEAIRHTTTREQFGAPLWKLGGVSASLSSSWIDIEMARSLTYRAAAAAARDPLGNLHLSSMAKVAATEAAGRVTDRSVQAMGRFGLVRGSKVERLYRDARPMRVYEGATEVIYDSLARKLVKDYTS